MNQSTYSNFDPAITDKDQEYLRHISQVLQQEGIDSFDLNKLTPDWLTSNELHRSAHYWHKYYATRLFGWIAGGLTLLVGSIGSAFVVGLLALSAASGGDGSGFFLFMIMLIIAGIILVALVIAYAVSHLFTMILTGKDLGRFDPDPLNNRDHKAILWALKQQKLLPKRHRIWLRQMSDRDVIIDLGDGLYRLTGIALQK